MTVLAQIKEEHRGPHAMARIEGEIDASNVGWIESRLRGLLTNRSEGLIVDLTHTSYLDSTGIALMFSLASSLREHQQMLQIVVAGGSPIARMVALTGLDRAAPTHPTLEAALDDV